MRLIVSATIAALSASAASGQIANGSFENFALAGPGRVELSSLTDWTGSGGQTLLERGVNGVSLIAAHSGEQFVSMGHNGAQGDTLSQLIATVPETVYTVSFYLHCIQGNALQTVIGSAVSGDVLGSVEGNVSSTTQGWIEYTFEFEATGPQTEIRFVHSLGAAGANVAIDSVTVVPGPGVMALVGAAALVGSRRRR